jgi:CRISPR-associated protein Cas2
MRNVYLVTYDIRNDKRLRRVFKVMKGFGQHLQYSVFRCELTQANRLRMKTALAETIDQRVDQVLIFDFGPSDGYRVELVESIGQRYVEEGRDAVVV